MSALSDILTVGLVLILLFGSVSLYLYTRIQQAEKKVSLLESILLDIKMNAEMKDYGNLPAFNEDILQPTGYTPLDLEESDIEEQPTGISGHPPSPTSSVSSKSEYKTLDEVEESDEITESCHNTTEVQQEELHTQEKVSVNYESMSIKELHHLGKQRNILNGNTMKRKQLIEALKTSDRTLDQPGSFLETSTFLQGV